MKLDPKREQRRKGLLTLIKRKVPVVLRKFPTISKIWIVGSIAKPIFFDMNSDVDVVVDGLPGERYFELHAFLQKELKSAVDLIALADLQGENLEVLKNKVVIYEKVTVRGKTDIRKRGRILSKKDRRTRCRCQ